MVDTILSAIGDVGALAAAVLAFLALGKASAVIKQTEAARVDAERAAKDAAADRQDAERDRMCRRIEKVGESLRQWRPQRRCLKGDDGKPTATVCA
jgi:hypothetical protein